MTIPDELVTAAADAKCLTRIKRWGVASCENEIRKHPECALAAAFAKLPVEELREQAREAAGAKECVAWDGGVLRRGADAASDVWLAALTGLTGTTPREQWVCPHDRWGNDPDTATYCADTVFQVPPLEVPASEESGAS